MALQAVTLPCTHALRASVPVRSLSRNHPEQNVATSPLASGADLAPWDESAHSSRTSDVRRLVGGAAAATSWLSWRRRRRWRCAMRAAGRPFRPPLPPYWNRGGQGETGKVIDVTPPEAPVVKSNVYIHPVVLKLETALVADSIRTLCRVLAGASGRIVPAVDDPDRTKKPIMESAVTVRSLLRFVELRHGATDDLTPADFRSTAGDGMRILLRKCKEYDTEVFKALESRGEDVIRVIRAFYDQAPLISKFLPFFRAIVEKATPAILRCKSEPLPRVLSFLEPYGDVHLHFLYRAAQAGSIRYRLAEFQPQTVLLDNVEFWMQKAQAGELSIIDSNRVRALVRWAVFWGIELPKEERTRWLAHVVWASSPHQRTADQELMESQLLEGQWDIDHPVQLFQLARRLVAEEVESEELFKLLGEMMRQNFRDGRRQEIVQALSDMDPGFQKFPLQLVFALVDITATFAEEATGEELEALTTSWSQRGLRLKGCSRVVVDRLHDRPIGDAFGPGAVARIARNLLNVDVIRSLVRPVLTKLLLLPRLSPGNEELAGSGNQADVPEADLNDRIDKVGDYETALDLLGKLWPPNGSPQPKLTEAEAIFRFVGPPVADALREADIAGMSIVDGIAMELLDQQETAAAAILAWWKDPGDRSLPELVCPMIMKAASTEQAIKIAADGDLQSQNEVTRSISLLARALKGDTLNLQTAEWAASPFCGGNTADVETALSVIASACVATGAPAGVLEKGCQRWLSNGRAPGALGMDVAVAAVNCWESQVVVSDSAVLSQTHEWLVRNVLGEATKDPTELRGALVSHAQLLPASSGQKKVVEAIQDIDVLMTLLDGRAPSLAELRRVGNRTLGELGPAGQAAISDATAFAWRSAIPGLSPALAASHFSLWWRGLETDREMITSLVRAVVAELRHRIRLRAEATWGKGGQAGPQAPAWRLEGQRKVPWFVPSALVEEAYDRTEQPSGTFDTVFRGRAGKSEFLVEKAAAITGGRCMYCGSDYSLKAMVAFPEQLGGNVGEANLTVCCAVCDEFSQRVGSKQWGEALLAKPENASDVWWKAQKLANTLGMANLAGVAQQQ